MIHENSISNQESRTGEETGHMHWSALYLEDEWLHNGRVRYDKHAGFIIVNGILFKAMPGQA